jgi:hypothetical protein
VHLEAVSGYWITTLTIDFPRRGTALRLFPAVTIGTVVSPSFEASVAIIAIDGGFWKGSGHATQIFAVTRHAIFNQVVGVRTMKPDAGIPFRMVPFGGGTRVFR